MKLTIGSLVGLLAGLAGAAIWAAAVHFTGWEMSYLAWAIGLAVGLTVHRGAASLGPAKRGLLALVITLVAILGGKLVTSVLLAERAAADEVLAVEPDLLSVENPERVISYLADEVVLRRLEGGETVAWPEGVDALFAAKETDYPPEVWAEAVRLWEGKNLEARQRYIEEIRASSSHLVREQSEHSAWETFRASVGPMDLLFFALAVITAFKAGAGKIA